MLSWCHQFPSLLSSNSTRHLQSHLVDVVRAMCFICRSLPRIFLQSFWWHVVLDRLENTLEYIKTELRVISFLEIVYGSWWWHNCYMDSFFRIRVWLMMRLCSISAVINANNKQLLFQFGQTVSSCRDKVQHIFRTGDRLIVCLKLRDTRVRRRARRIASDPIHLVNHLFQRRSTIPRPHQKPLHTSYHST